MMKNVFRDISNKMFNRLSLKSRSPREKHPLISQHKIMVPRAQIPTGILILLKNLNRRMDDFRNNVCASFSPQLNVI